LQLTPAHILWSYDQWYTTLMLLAIVCSCVNGCRIEMEKWFLFTNWDGEIKHREWELERKDKHREWELEIKRLINYVKYCEFWVLIWKRKSFNSLLFTFHIIILILMPQLDYSLAFHSWFIGSVAKIMDVIISPSFVWFFFLFFFQTIPHIVDTLCIYR